METFILYLLKSAGCLAVFYVCFKALFSNDTFFRFNRWLLLAGTLICMFLPLCRIQMSQPVFIQQPMDKLEMVFSGQEKTEASFMAEKVTASPEKAREEVSWMQILWIGYLTGCAVCLGTTLVSFRKIQELIRQGKQIQAGSYKLVTIPVSIAPFSWNRYIFLSEEDYRNHPEEILTHEKMHLQYYHSADLVYMELILLLQWFNPAVWLLKRELRDIHEYQADMGVLNQGIDATKYQLLLVKKAVGSSLYTLANSFNHSKIKKRITMMLRKKSNGWVRLKLALLVPVGLIALSVFAHPGTVLVPVEVPPPVVATEPIKETPLSTTDKSTNLQKQIQESYNVYLSFTKNDEAGKEGIGGISIYGVSEEKALALAEKAIKNGSFKTATKVIICPHSPKVPMNYLEKMKALFDRNNIKCLITKAQGYDKDGNLLPTPPPPPPAPDIYVTFSYKSGKKDEGMLVYERHLKTEEEINKRFDKIYSDDISTVTITDYKWSKAGVLESIEKFLKDKIKYDVEYKVEHRE